MAEIIELVPAQDAAPSLPSRLVSVNLAGPTEGRLSEGERTVTFRLVGDIHSAKDRIIVGAGYTVTATSGQHVRLPCYDGTTGEWAIEVRKSWAPHPYAIRVPAGATPVDLSAQLPVMTLPGALAQYAISGAGVQIVHGAQWDARVTLTGGVLGFVLTVPPAGTAHAKGRLASGSDLNTITQPGQYLYPADALNRPSDVGGLLIADGALGSAWQLALPGGYEGGLRARFMGSVGWTHWATIEATRTVTSGTVDANKLLPGTTLVAPAVTQQNFPESGRMWEVTSRELGTATLQTARDGGDGTIWTRFSGSKGWSIWAQTTATRYVMSGDYDADAARAGTDMITLGAAKTNMPPGTDTAWRMATYRVTSSSRQQVAQPVGHRGTELWTRFSGSLGWSDWQRIDAGAVTIPPPAPTVTAAGGRTWRRVPIALTLGTSPGSISGDFAIRLPITLGVGIKRWRVHIDQRNPRTGATASGPLTLSGIWLSTLTQPGAMASGAMSDNLAPGTTTVTEHWVSPWLTLPLEAGTSHALSIAGTGASHQRVLGGGWRSASQTDASDPSGGAMTRTADMPIDVWLEVEAHPDIPLLGAFGDSLSSGVSATLPVHDSWVNQAARQLGALPIHYAASGDTMAGWADPTAHKRTRWQHLAQPDVLIHAMGSNDIFANAVDLPTLKDRRAESMAWLTALAPTIYSSTIWPREAITGAMEDIRRAYNAWLQSQPDEARIVIDTVSAVSLDDETLIDSIDADGTHLTTAGYTAVAQAIIAAHPLPTA